MRFRGSWQTTSTAIRCACLAAALLLTACGDLAGSGIHPRAIDASGGDDLTPGGQGGRAYGIDIDMVYGSDNLIEVRTEGRVDASFTPSEIPPDDFGDQPLVVSEDLALEFHDTEPPVGTLYVRYNRIRRSNGNGETDDDPEITGLWVQSGATLTLPLNDYFREKAVASFTHDVRIDGDLTVPQIDDDFFGHLFVYAGGHFLLNGRILSHGRASGQRGGDVEIRGDGDVRIHGQLLVNGAHGTEGRGGWGGEVVIRQLADWSPDLVFEVTGLIDIGGGMALGESGSGGRAGQMWLLGAMLEISGSLRGRGGDALSTDDDIASKGDSGGQIHLTGVGLRLSSDIVVDGGRSASDDAGAGGRIEMHFGRAGVRASGALLARGGATDGPGERGGKGGIIEIYGNAQHPVPPRGSEPIPLEDFELSGPILATAGRGERTNGGHIRFHIDNGSDGLESRTLRLIGYEAVRSPGGDGERYGGSGGSISIATYNPYWPATGTVIVEPPMDASGGNADPERIGSEGGWSGDIEILAESIDYGEVRADGGVGEEANGGDGTITPETPAP